MTRRASCACGRLMISLRGDPTRVSLCHCRDCQRRTGSPFGVVAFFEEVAMEGVRGTSRIYRRQADSGYHVTFHFCPDCGATVFWWPERLRGLVGVAVGAFADPDFPAPDQAVFGRSRHGWLAPSFGIEEAD